MYLRSCELKPFPAAAITIMHCTPEAAAATGMRACMQSHCLVGGSSQNALAIDRPYVRHHFFPVPCCEGLGKQRWERCRQRCGGGALFSVPCMQSARVTIRHEARGIRRCCSSVVSQGVRACIHALQLAANCDCPTRLRASVFSGVLAGASRRGVRQERFGGRQPPWCSPARF